MSRPTLPPLVRKCCQCGRSEHNGAWQLYDEPADTAFTHTYCPPCFILVMRQINHRIMRGNHAAIGR